MDKGGGGPSHLLIPHPHVPLCFASTPLKVPFWSHMMAGKTTCLSKRRTALLPPLVNHNWWRPPPSYHNPQSWAWQLNLCFLDLLQLLRAQSMRRHWADAMCLHQPHVTNADAGTPTSIPHWRWCCWADSVGPRALGRSTAAPLMHQLNLELDRGGGGQGGRHASLGSRLGLRCRQ